MIRFLIVSALLLLFFPMSAYAQQVHLGIEPTSIQIDATPPADIKAPFLISNLSSASVELTLRLIPFKPRDDGKIDLLISEEKNLSSIIRDRLVILDEDEAVKTITLRAGESKTLFLFLELNEGDPVGDYYFSLVFMSGGNDLDETSASSIPAGIATNVLLSIGPESDPTAHFSEFSAPKFVTSGPVPFTVKLTNDGNHLIQPRGFITIKNMLGKEVGRINILPQYLPKDASRFLVDSSQASPSAELNTLMNSVKAEHPVVIWDEKFLLGPYTATANITMDEAGSSIIEKSTFIALPLQIIALISGIIFVALGIGLRIYYKMHRKTT